MRRFAILALLAFLAGGSQALSAPGKAAAPQATFGATADAYVSSAARRTNFGRARSLRVSPRPVMRTYLRFQVSGLSGARRPGDAAGALEDAQDGDSRFARPAGAGPSGG